VIPASLVFLYFLFTLVKIRFPGIQYDEILFGNVAVGGVDHSFIFYKIGNFPFLLMAFIGALKAYLYFPIFKLFGVSTYTIRIPMIFLAGIALIILYKTLKNCFNQFIASVALLFLSLDASFISYARYDVGPTTISFFCKVLVIYYFVKLKENAKISYSIAMGIVMALGLFNKLNFIWFINAFAISAVMVYWPEIKQIFRVRTDIKRRYIFYLFVFFYILFVAYYLLLNWKFNLTGFLQISEFPNKIAKNLSSFADLVNGTLFYNFVFGSLKSLVNQIFAGIIMVLFFFGLYRVLLKKRFLKEGKFKLYLFFFLIFCLMFIQIFITQKAIQGWHLFELYPFFTILLVAGMTLNWPKDRQIAFSKNLGSVFVILLVLSYQIYLESQYIEIYDKPVKNINWSSKIYDLIDYTKSDNRIYVSVDWGTHNQLISFTGLRNKYLEIAYGLYQVNIDEDQRKWLIQEILNPEKNYVLIMYPQENSTLGMSQTNLKKIAQEASIRLQKIETFSEGGRVVYELYIPVKAI